MTIGSRRSRLVAGIWALVGVGFLAAQVLLWLDAERLSFELPAAVLAFVFALAWRRQRAELDRHGIRTVHAFREHRLLWAGIDRVEIRRSSSLRPALVLHPKGAGSPIPVPASAGLRRHQRDRLLELLTDLAHQHRFVLVTPTSADEDSSRPTEISDDPVVRIPSGPPAAAPAGTPGPDDPEPAEEERPGPLF